MRFFLMSVLAGVITFIPTFIITRLLKRHEKKQNKDVSKKKRVIWFVAIWLVFYVIGAVGYFAPYYHAGETAAVAMQGSDDVSVFEVNNGMAIFFDGPGDEVGMVFYPGAKVDAKAYAPIMLSLAEAGIDCFVVNMPAHMAFFGRDRGPKLIAQYDYEKWIIGGHSLGGAMISPLALSVPDIAGVVLFASYPPNPIPAGMPMLLFRGSEDNVLNMKAYEESRAKWSDAAVEIVIQGGNHAGYADYGVQRGDGVATISPEEQQAQVAADIIGTFLN